MNVVYTVGIRPAFVFGWPQSNWPEVNNGSWQKTDSWIFGRIFLSLSPDVLSLTLLLISPPLSKSTVSLLSSLPVLYFCHNTQQYLITQDRYISLLFGFINSLSFEEQFKMLTCSKSLQVTSFKFICLVLSLQEVYKNAFHLYLLWKAFITTPSFTWNINAIYVYLERTLSSLLIFANITFQSLCKFVILPFVMGLKMVMPHRNGYNCGFIQIGRWFLFFSLIY